MASEEIDKQLERLSTQKGVKAVLAMNWEGEIITSSINDKTFDEETIKAYQRLAFQVSNSLRSAIEAFDATELLQYGRMRMKDSELVLVPEKKYLLVAIQDPNV